MMLTLHAPDGGYFFRRLRFSSASRSMSHCVESSSMSAAMLEQNDLNSARCSRVIKQTKRTTSCGEAGLTGFLDMTSDSIASVVIRATIACWNDVDNTKSGDIIGVTGTRKETMMKLDYTITKVSPSYGPQLYEREVYTADKGIRVAHGFSDTRQEATRECRKYVGEHGVLVVS